MHATTSNPKPSDAVMPVGASTAKALEFLAFTLSQEGWSTNCHDNVTSNSKTGAY